MQETVLIVGVSLPDDQYFEASMNELAELALACNLKAIERVTQSLPKINKVTYVNKGKAFEIKYLMEAHDIDTVIFNDELSPAQIRNLELILQCKILDRTSLILEIFASRARTKEAMLQVEIARLKYLYPRLVGLKESMSHQQGGSGFRGVGEKQIELDRRRISKRINLLKKQLQQLTKIRQTQRLRRNKGEVVKVSLVGYTNAGKSTIMNYLSEQSKDQLNKKVFEKDMLFATLETSTRQIILPQQQPFLLTDTIGFIHKLPHHLVEAFQSTLEEVKEADLLLHVIDASSSNQTQQVETVQSVLKSLKADHIPVIYVYNKIDIPSPHHPIYQPFIEVSAKTGFNMTVLIKRIASELSLLNQASFYLIPYDQYKAYLHLKKNYYLLNEVEKENGIYVEVALNEKDEKQYQQYQLSLN